MVDDVLRDVLLRAGELVEAGRDVGGERLVAAGGRGHDGCPRHGGPSFDDRLVTSCPFMKRLETRFDGPVVLAPTVHGDERGVFAETYRADAWAAHGVPAEFVEDNQSRSRRGTVRGIHFQTDPGQAKLVRVARGQVYDVLVDLRRESPTFG